MRSQERGRVYLHCLDLSYVCVCVCPFRGGVCPWTLGGSFTWGAGGEIGGMMGEMGNDGGEEGRWGEEEIHFSTLLSLDATKIRSPLNSFALFF